MRGPACNRCVEHGLDCVAGVGGKAMVCIACQDMKAKCEWPGEESGEKKVRWRKRVVEESPKGKKGKKAQTEPEAGLSRGAALEGLQVSSKVVENLGDLMRGLLWRLDRQNALLAQLVQQKADEVWCAETSDGEGLDVSWRSLMWRRWRSRGKRWRHGRRKWMWTQREQRRPRRGRRSRRSRRWVEKTRRKHRVRRHAQAPWLGAKMSLHQYLHIWTIILDTTACNFFDVDLPWNQESRRSRTPVLRPLRPEVAEIVPYFGWCWARRVLTERRGKRGEPIS